MPSRAEYRNAAEEHLRGGIACHQAGAYNSAHYLFGHSVECIIRAFGASEDRVHNLRRQLEISGYENIVPSNRQQEFTTMFQEIESRWRSPDRFEDAGLLTRNLNRRGVTIGVKGDKLKENSARMLTAAQTVVGLGVERWK